MVLTVPHTRRISAGATRHVGFDLTNELKGSALLTGTPTVVEISTSDLTLTNKQVSTSSTAINGRTVATGKAVLFTVAGQQAGTNYAIRITVSTDDSQTIVYDVTLVCVA